MSSFLATYATKAAAPVQASWKGNTVEAQLINRSRWAMPKVLKRQHRDAQVAHKCVSPPPFLHGGEWLSVLCFSDYLFYVFFTHLYVLSCPILTGRFCLLSKWYFILHFTSCIAQQCFSIALFRMGESDYLEDNLNAEAILRKRKIIFFLLFLGYLRYASKNLNLSLCETFVSGGFFTLFHCSIPRARNPGNHHTRGSLKGFLCVHFSLYQTLSTLSTLSLSLSLSLSRNCEF